MNVEEAFKNFVNGEAEKINEGAEVKTEKNNGITAIVEKPRTETRRLNADKRRGLSWNGHRRSVGMVLQRTGESLRKEESSGMAEHDRPRL